MAMLQPYQNVLDGDLPDEIWLPLPNLDGNFFISNLGRVKSTDRYIETKNGKTIFYEGQVYKQQILHYPNATTNDAALELKVGFYYKGKNYNVRVARMVYHLFVAPILPSMQHYYVGFKDGNNLHAWASNLQLISPHQKMYQMFHNQRCRPIYTFQKPDTNQKRSLARYKPVTQFNQDGQPIAQYPSIKAAAAQTGLSNSNIVAALKQRNMVRSGGYLWQYGHIATSINTDYIAAFINKS